MSLVSFISFTHKAMKQRAAVRKQHGGQLPHIMDGIALTGRLPASNPDVQDLPVAHVVEAAPGGEAPVATAESTPALNSDHEVVLPAAVHAAHAQWNGEEVHGATHVSGDAMLQHHAYVPNSTDSGPVAESIERDIDNAAPESSARGLGLGLGGDSKHGQHALRSVIEESAEAAAESAGQKQNNVSLVKKLWDSIREDPESGFRYSVFVGASLLVTIITLSAALLRALQQVCRLAACSEAEGTCLYDVQRFVYKRLVRTFAKMDAETLELQATGLCRAFSTGNSSSIDPLDRGLQTNLITAERCADVQQLESSQAQFDHPDWLANAKRPEFIGGHIGFVVAYCLGLYTIFHVARAYKKLELKRQTADISELASAAASSSAATAATYKTKLGKDIVEDYKLVNIGQSAYFTGTLVSTCFVQLCLAGVFLGSVIMLLLHRQFWELVWEHRWWPVSVVLIFKWHEVPQMILNKYITDGKRIKWPFWWLFLYPCIWLLWRLIQLMLTSNVALSRLDACLFTVMKGADRGYASFLAMALMLHSFQDCLLEKQYCRHDNAASLPDCERVESFSAPDQRPEGTKRSLQSVRH